MTADFMRLVDKWVGIPLCMLFSGIHRLMSLLTGSASPQQMKTIAIVQMSERGAAILAHSALVKIKTTIGRY